MGCGGGGRGWDSFYRVAEGEARRHQGGVWPAMVGIQFPTVSRSKRGRGVEGAELVRESEGSWEALRFGSIRVREGGHRRNVTQRHGQMGGGLGIPRKEKGPWWAGAGPQRPGGPERSGGLKRVDGP
jgi:hypothetical protein